MIRSVLIAVLLLSVSSNAQHQGQPIRVAVLPFVDLLGKPGSHAAAFTDLLLSRLAREDELLVKMAVPDKPGAVIDREAALNLGRKQGASLLLLGSIEAVETRQSRNGPARARAGPGEQPFCYGKSRSRSGCDLAVQREDPGDDPVGWKEDGACQPDMDQQPRGCHSPGWQRLTGFTPGAGDEPMRRPTCTADRAGGQKGSVV
jgi:hypothetical protein